MHVFDPREAYKFTVPVFGKVTRGGGGGVPLLTVGHVAASLQGIVYDVPRPKMLEQLRMAKTGLTSGHLRAYVPLIEQVRRLLCSCCSIPIRACVCV